MRHGGPLRWVTLWALLALVALVGPEVRAASRPNLLFLSIDTLRADHVSCYGYSLPTTPTLDQMARNGTRFAQARSVAPWTLPSFASMMTGRYPTRHGAEVTGPLRDLSTDTPRVLASSAVTLGERLRDAGYRTAAFTSNPYLHLGPLRGFEEGTHKTVRADRIGALTRTWIDERARRQPWALWVHFNDPHEPTIAADAYLDLLGYGRGVQEDPDRGDLERWGDREKGTHLGRTESVEAAGEKLRTKIALYDATIRQVDTEIGRILELLHRRGVLRNTLVVVVSDHGEEFLDHVEEERRRGEDPRGVYGIGHGHTLYEEQLHVPLILMGPGVGVADVVDEQFPLVDLMPTLLGLLRLDPPAGMDGRDRRGWMVQRERAPIPMAAESIAYGPDRMAWIDGRWKLVCDRTGRPLRLFNLILDPHEKTNRVAAVDSLAWAAALRDSLLQWNERMLEQAPPPGSAADLSDEMRDGLRSLGYVQ